MAKCRNRVKVYTTTALVRLTDEQNEIIKKAAAEADMKVSSYMRLAMTSFKLKETI